MLGVEFDFDVSALRKMIIDKHILQKCKTIKNLLRILPLTIKKGSN
jgi:hypothetical protein